MKRLTFILLAGFPVTACHEAPTQVNDWPPALSVVTEITTTDLGVLLGSEESLAFGLNNVGQVVGASFFRDCFCLRGFLWSDGLMVELVGPGNPTITHDVNDSGVAVGWSGRSPMAWVNGVAQELSPGEAGQAFAVNNLGQIVGVSNNQPVLWQGGAKFDLGIPAPGRATDINDLSQIVGSFSSESGSQRAFLWNGGGFTDLGTLGGSTAVAYAINNASQIVGESRTADGSRNVFLWEEGQMRDLGPGLVPLKSRFGIPLALNDLGQIAGSMGDRAFLWDDGQIVDVGGVGSAAFGVNSGSEVVGWRAVAPDFFAHATRWAVSTRSATPQEETLILRELLQVSISNGVLDLGQGNALLSKLDVIDRQLEKGNIESAAGLFQAFSNQVQAFVSAGILRVGQGQPLIDAAQNAIDQLNV